MIVLNDPRWLLLLPPLLALALWAWRDGPFNLGSRRRVVALATRLVIVTVIVLGLCGLSLSLPQRKEAVVFVADRSASNAGNRSSMEATVNAAAAQRPRDGVVGVVSVGRDAVVEQPASPLTSFDGFQAPIDTDYTDLERGLELASSTLPGGYRRRIVVMTDGRQNVGDALSTARLLRDQGVRIDVLPEHSVGGPDARVDSVDIPQQLHTRERFTLTVSLHSNVNTPARIDIYRDHTLLMSQQERIVAGESEYAFPQGALQPGVHTYQVRISPRTDTVPQNNMGSAVTSVQGAPRVLVIAFVSTDAINVVRSLRSTGIEADLRGPQQVVPTLSFLQRYASIVLVNTPTAALDPALLDDFVPYVRDLGRGLVVIGGEDAYALGSYGHTPLEQVLPVSMELPKRKELPSVAVALLIESLEATLPVDISREAGIGVIKLLTERDLVGVNDAPDDGTAGWVIPLEHPRDKAAMYRIITDMHPGDPNTYTPFLKQAFEALKATHARVKHIILLGDGDAQSPSYQAVVQAMHAGGVTISTVVTNAATPSDYQTMRNIARWGGGRYYRADNVANVPRIFLREARTLTRSGVVTGRFYPEALSSNPILRDVHRVPSLDGYVATSAKPSAEVVLASRKLDPVLATWQYGLGRTAAWTSDAAGLWTRSWLTAPGANRFWSNLVSWTFPASTPNHLFAATSAGSGQGQISVATPLILGLSPSVTARVVSPDLHATTVELQPSAPGRYRGTFPAGRQGAYFVSVEARGAGHVQTGRSGLDVPYSAEYQTTGADMSFLRDLAGAGGGSLISSPAAAWQDNLAAVYDQRSLADPLWLLALLLLPIDIGLRRLVVRRPRGAEQPSGVSQPSGARTPAAGAAASPVVARRWGLARAPGASAILSRAESMAGAARFRMRSSDASASQPAAPPLRSTTGRGPGIAPAASTASRLLAAKRRRQAEEAGSG